MTVVVTTFNQTKLSTSTTIKHLAWSQLQPLGYCFQVSIPCYLKSFLQLTTIKGPHPTNPSSPIPPTPADTATMSNQPPIRSYSTSSGITQASRPHQATPYAPPYQYQSRLPLPQAPTTPLPPPRANTTTAIPYIRVNPPSLPVSRVLFPSQPRPVKWREHPGLSRIPRLVPTPETPTPPGRKRERLPREVSSAPGSLRDRDRGWSIDGRVKARKTVKRGLATPSAPEQGPEPSNDTARTWPLMDMERLSLHEGLSLNPTTKEEGEAENENEEAEDESMTGITHSLATGGKRRTSFRKFVKKIRRSFSKVAEKLRD